MQHGGEFQSPFCELRVWFTLHSAPSQHLRGPVPKVSATPTCHLDLLLHFRARADVRKVVAHLVVPVSLVGDIILCRLDLEKFCCFCKGRLMTNPKLGSLQRGRLIERSNRMSRSHREHQHFDLPLPQPQLETNILFFHQRNSQFGSPRFDVLQTCWRCVQCIEIPPRAQLLVDKRAHRSVAAEARDL